MFVDNFAQRDRSGREEIQHANDDLEPEERDKGRKYPWDVCNESHNKTERTAQQNEREKVEAENPLPQT